MICFKEKVIIMRKILNKVCASTVASILAVSAMPLAFIVLSVLAALLTAWESTTKDNGNEDRETWLRQKHYLAKLKLETENFLYNWDTKNQESDNDTPQNRLNDYINKIVELRKEDWSNFFDNMQLNIVFITIL